MLIKVNSGLKKNLKISIFTVSMILETMDRVSMSTIRRDWRQC